MAFPNRSLITVAVLAAALVPVFAQNQKADEPTELSAKEATYARMIDVAREIQSYRAQGWNDYQLAPLVQQYQRMSAQFGGDDPAFLFGAGRAPQAAGSQPGQQALLAAPSACGATPVTGSFAGTTGDIGIPGLPQVPSTFTTMVSGLGTYLWDVNLTTFIDHTSCADLDISLTSPAGTVVVITTDNGGTNDNLYNGTLWDDNVNDPVTDKTYTNNVLASPLSPEGRLEAFRGEDPNGTWTLTILDDAAANLGNLTAWSLDISTLAGAPAPTTTNFTSSPGIVIPTTAPPNINSDNILVSGLGTYLAGVTLYLEVPHTFAGDLDITLTSAAGTVVTVTTDNGGGNDNVYNGTLFDPNAPDTVTDFLYTNNVTAVTLSPEGAFDNFLGQDPNGTWTLTVSDDATGDGGTLVRWDLNLTTIAAPTPSAPSNFVGTTGALPDNGGATASTTSGTFVFTATAAGLPTYLWDVDLNTNILHTNAADLDITLTSPAGTVVNITTDNGGTNDDVYNGTLWDDNSNDPVTDHVYANLTVASPLSPEGRLTAFRGEDPNGLWTLTVTDDASSNLGVLTAWSLDLAALSSAPSESTTVFSQSPNLVIPTTAPPNAVSDVIAVAGLGTSVTDVKLYMEVLHTFSSDLDITLTSAAGTVVTVTTDNGSSFDNVYNGTLFDGDSLDTVTDHVYANNVVAVTLSPEGAFGNFQGEDPNGNWTLTINDDANGDGGTFVRWDLTITTCAGATPPTAFCFGDGSGTACPCGNAGAAGNGCANSLNPNGANLAFSGTASIGADTFVLQGSGMPDSFALYFQGTAQENGGAGTVFGDGLLCASGTQARLKTVLNVAGASQYPGVGDPSISVQGGVAAPGVRTYQVWYRNAAAFCTTDTFNLTNGVLVTWAP